MKDWGQWEDVREQERQARDAHAALITNIRVAISIADGLLQITTSGGYKHLQTAFEDMLKHRTTELLSARDDRSATLLQGRCQELKAILSLVTATKENRQVLARTLEEEENRFRDLERSFKPLPAGAQT